MAARKHITGLALFFGLAALESSSSRSVSAQPAASESAAPTVPAGFAANRLERAQTLMRLKNHPAATTLLWDVVALGPADDELSYRDALYTLGEALYQQGEARTAQRIFTQLVELSPPSPRAPQALVRLLELAVELHSDERADEWISRLSRLSENELPPQASYVQGRYLLLSKRYADARAALARVSASGAYALRARYLVGAALTAIDKLGEAEAEFTAIVSAPVPELDDERRAVELSYMALGRIYHAAGKSDKAHDAYLHISQKSDLFRDAIYEAAWSAIRTNEYERAEQALSLLLLAYRDAHESSYAATEAKMLLGNLLLRRGEPDAALDYFEQAKKDAAPVVEGLSEKLSGADKLSALITADPRGFELAKLSPPAALPLFHADVDVTRFLALQREIRALSRAVQEIESTVAMLEKTQPAIGKERDAAQGYRQTLQQLEKDAAQNGSALLSAVGQSAQKKFAEVLMRAEAGILDVAWARKVRHSEKVASLGRDEKRELRILDDEFGSEKTDAPVEKAPEKTADKPADAATAKAAEKPAPAIDLPPGMPADVGEDLRRYLETAETLRQTLTELGQEGYVRRRKELLTEYADRIRVEEQEESAARTQAIAQFEQFLTRYPNHARFTPDAIFRLAELYFERSSEEFAQVVKKQSDGGETSGLPDYGPSVELYRRLLREYPKYRLSDGVHYLLGYCLGEMAKDAESRQAFLGLSCSNRYQPLDAPAPWPGRKLKTDPFKDCEPLKADSRFLAETWTRLGEQHFDRGELDAAIAAYGRVLPFRDSPFFDKALYKLAWSFYRADRFADSVRRFDELVVFADSKNGSRESLESRPRPRAIKKGGSTLRSESVQYLALCFAERDWNGDGKTDLESGLSRLESFYRGRENEPHVREVLVRLGDIWYERTEFGRAAEAYKLAVAKSPLAPDNPRLQERVVASYDRLRSFEQALRAREALSRDYAPGSAWYNENQGDAEALASAAELADASLLHAITNRHASAQELRQKALEKKGKPDAKLLAQARDGYRQAAESYAAYLKQHPQAKNAYEYSYLYAESLFYAGEYAQAAATYARVREADPKGSHLEEAAYGAVKAQEHVALNTLRGDAKPQDGDGDDVSKRLDEKLPPLPAPGKLQPPVAALSVPQEVEDLQVAYERYVALLPQSERAALMAYKSAELDFRYQRFDRARQRFTLVLDRYCQSDRAVDSGNAILVTHTIEGNLDQVESWTSRIAQRGCGGGGALAAEQRDNLKKLSEDVSFKKAEQLLDAKQYDAAAAMFAAIVEKNPRAATADKALNNAAFAYENMKRYGTAANLYERLARDFSTSPLADEALFRAAVNQQKLFMFDKALLAYRAIATLPRYAKSPHRRDALYNAALLADRDGDTALGIELWRTYMQDASTSPAEGDEAAYRIALLNDRAALRSGNAQAAVDEWERYQRRAAPHADSDPQVLPHLVEAYYRVGRAQELLHNPFDARETYAKAAKLGGRLQAGSDGAEFAAHAAFLYAGRHLGDLERLRIGGSGDELSQSISKFNSAVTVAIGDYEKVLSFRRATWTLAAYFRMGYVTELYAKALLAAPCPPEVRRLGEGACSLYRTKIEENVAQIEEKAVARYAVTIEQAARFGVGNNWTKEARARLSGYRPDKYPLLHDEHIAQGLDAGSGPSSSSTSAQAQTLTEARAALTSKQYETASVLARQVLAEDERSVPAILILARAYYQRGKLDLATALIGSAQQIDANSGEAYLLLGMLTLAREDGDRIAATSAFKRATELDPNLGAAWHNLAAQYLSAKNYEQALGAAQRASSLLFGAGSAGVQLNLGSALRGLGRHAEAEGVYRRIVEMDPQYLDGYWNLGVLYLDAPQFSGDSLATQKKAALQYLMRYQDLARDKRDEATDTLIKEARAAVEREERKQKRKPGGGP